MNVTMRLQPDTHLSLIWADTRAAVSRVSGGLLSPGRQSTHALPNKDVVEEIVDKAETTIFDNIWTRIVEDRATPERQALDRAFAAQRENDQPQPNGQVQTSGFGLEVPAGHAYLFPHRWAHALETKGKLAMSLELRLAVPENDSQKRCVARTRRSPIAVGGFSILSGHYHNFQGEEAHFDSCRVSLAEAFLEEAAEKLQTKGVSPFFQQKIAALARRCRAMPSEIYPEVEEEQEQEGDVSDNLFALNISPV